MRTLPTEQNSLYISIHFFFKSCSLGSVIYKKSAAGFLQRILWTWLVFKFISDTSNAFDVIGHIRRDFQFLPYIADMVVDSFS